jgi:hypothetical protein
MRVTSADGNRGMITGEAKDEKELFEFTIAPFVSGGFLLTIKYSGDCHYNVTGAGVWQLRSLLKNSCDPSLLGMTGSGAFFN